MPLVVYLYRKRGIHTVGNLNRTRILNTPFTPIKLMERKFRVYYEHFVTTLNGVVVDIMSG